MELITKKRLHIVAGRNNRELAEEVAARLGEQLGHVALAAFANGELHCRYGESIRGADVFIFQGHSSTSEMSINDALMEQLIMVDAARRASAKRITVVAPWISGRCWPFCRPSMWKSGATVSTTESHVTGFQAAEAVSEASSVACVWRQPLGWPVVPLV